MNRFLNQALGREPEPVWMSAIGAACAIGIPAIVALVCVAFGWGQ